MCSARTGGGFNKERQFKETCDEEKVYSSNHSLLGRSLTKHLLDFYPLQIILDSPFLQGSLNPPLQPPSLSSSLLLGNRGIRIAFYCLCKPFGFGDETAMCSKE
jgi:hypothetical protein